MFDEIPTFKEFMGIVAAVLLGWLFITGIFLL